MQWQVKIDQVSIPYQNQPEPLNIFQKQKQESQHFMYVQMTLTTF